MRRIRHRVRTPSPRLHSAASCGAKRDLKRSASRHVAAPPRLFRARNPGSDEVAEAGHHPQRPAPTHNDPHKAIKSHAPASAEATLVTGVACRHCGKCLPSHPRHPWRAWRPRRPHAHPSPPVKRASTHIQTIPCITAIEPAHHSSATASPLHALLARWSSPCGAGPALSLGPFWLNPRGATWSHVEPRGAPPSGHVPLACHESPLRSLGSPPSQQASCGPRGPTWTSSVAAGKLRTTWTHVDLLRRSRQAADHVGPRGPPPS